MITHNYNGLTFNLTERPDALSEYTAYNVDWVHPSGEITRISPRICNKGVNPIPELEAWIDKLVKAAKDPLAPFAK